MHERTQTNCNNLSLVWYKATNVWHPVSIESIRGVISLLTSTHKHPPKVLYFHKIKKGQILHFDSNQITGKVGLVLTTEDGSTFDNISLFCCWTISKFKLNYELLKSA